MDPKTPKLSEPSMAKSAASQALPNERTGPTLGAMATEPAPLADLDPAYVEWCGVYGYDTGDRFALAIYSLDKRTDTLEVKIFGQARG